ncbi:restriction modification system DNA specificity domain-containing protein [Bacillus cereus]|uniref:restriction endonuclease subunit S n=1 Tax=Bacillus cereus group TaxID=86661 RepID=UPI000789D0C9|nr:MULTISPECIES: restriction endonuclease subunit S [Bacillus cereus group]KYQ00963.1 Type I restriction-modification system specificity subunit S [Bacillus cereus]MED1214295.1 restriction endonuclease subunit S [Bacillus paranthracis]BCC14004.1 restriction modification system DNA specificity domain-containing protein [Bacillus cereus]BCD01527.1 restriction modification system DNA specificity domain-containing protein [Bacillus cereus]HDR6306057.1 restriction endonuclease subunit S [Bacillus c
MSRKMKTSEVEWIGEVPVDWKIQRLKGVLLERKENNNPIKTDFILSLTMDRGVIPYNEKGSGGNKAKDDLSKYKLAYPNDVVLNSMNVIAGSVGLSRYFGCVSPVYYMLYPKNKDESVEYYNFVFQSKIFQHSLIGLGNGILVKQSESSGKLNTIRMRIPMEKLNAIMLPIPSPPEQQKIVNYLHVKINQIDKNILKFNEIIEDYKKYKSALISETVTRGLEPNNKMKDSGIPWIDEIPKDWVVCQLKRKMKVITDGAHISPETSDGKYDFISVVDIKNGKIDFKNSLKTSESSYKYLVKTGCKPQKNDVLLSKDGTIGKSVVVEHDGEFVVASSLIINRPNLNEVDPKFLHFLFQSNMIQSQLYSFLKGSALKRVSITNVKKILCVFPSLSEQKNISKFLEEKILRVDEIILEINKQIELLEKYRQSLIYEAVTGKIDVRNFDESQLEVK